MIGPVIAFVFWSLAVIAGLAAAFGAVVTDTYANWIVREQRAQHARRRAFARDAMRQVNFEAAHSGK